MTLVAIIMLLINCIITLSIMIIIIKINIQIIIFYHIHNNVCTLKNYNNVCNLFGKVYIIYVYVCDSSEELLYSDQRVWN